MMKRSVSSNEEKKGVAVGISSSAMIADNKWVERQDVATTQIGQ